jgi:hypothetical protein
MLQMAGGAGMKAAVASDCSCQWQKSPEMTLCHVCHRYAKNGKEYTSVSRVIKDLVPADYSGVDPVVLEIARLRGTYVDGYFSDWLRDPNDVMTLPEVREMVIPQFPREGEKHAEDTINRIDMLIEWWIGKGWKATGVQKTVYSDIHRVAGTLDLRTDGLIADVKCVSSLQPNYALQLGAYSTYDAASSIAIIHVTKDKVRLVEYDNQKCQTQWLNGLVWWQTRQELK